MKRTSNLLIMVFMVLAMPMFALAQDKTLTEATRQVVRNRNIVEQNVREIKKTFSSDKTEYKTAKDLYGTAQAEFDAFIEAAATSIQQGQKLNKEDIDEMAKDAVSASQKFIAYSREKRGVSGGFIDDLLKAGKVLFKLYKENKAEQRKARADELRKLKWKDWDSIS